MKVSRIAEDPKQRELFYAKLHARAHKIDPYRHGYSKPSFLKKNFGLLLTVGILAISVGVVLYDAVKENTNESYTSSEGRHH